MEWVLAKTGIWYHYQTFDKNFICGTNNRCQGKNRQKENIRTEVCGHRRLPCRPPCRDENVSKNGLPAFFRIEHENCRVGTYVNDCKIQSECLLSGRAMSSRRSASLTFANGIRQQRRPVYRAHSEQVNLQALDQPRLAIGPTPSLSVTSLFAVNCLKVSCSPLGQ